MSIYEYDEEGHMKVVREEGFQEGQASLLLPMIIIFSIKFHTLYCSNTFRCFLFLIFILL